MSKIKIKNSKNIVFIEMNNPPVNALSISFLNELHDAVDLYQDCAPSDVSMLVFKSLVGGFCAGADLKERAQMNVENAIQTVENIRELFRKIESISCPTIASIDGFALGGGLELALSCDFRFCSKNSILGLPETSLGIIPGAGGTQRLPRLIGLSKAKKWIFSAERFSATKALEDGVVDEIFNNSERMDNFIKKFAENIKRNSQSAVSLSKKAINYGCQKSFEQGLLIEREQYLETLDNSDRLEFLKKLKAKK